MKNILVLCLLCCYVPTVKGMMFQSKRREAAIRTSKGVVKPKHNAQKYYELELARAKRISTALNVALYYAGLAREELARSSDALELQAALIEKSGKQALKTIKNIEYQEGLLRRQIEDTHEDIVDTSIDVVFATNLHHELIS